MNILIVAAHPDDEILGCGGTMALHASCGDDVYVIFMADGVSSRKEKQIEDRHDERCEASFKACQLVGVKKTINLGFPDNQMDTLPLLEIVQSLELLIHSIQPHVIYTHHANDLNIDHKLTHQAVMTACRPLPNSSVKEIYSFEVLSSTGWESRYVERQFLPVCFVDVTEVWERKKSALRCYEKEIREYPHARSIRCVEALARYRGGVLV